MKKRSSTTSHALHADGKGVASAEVLMLGSIATALVILGSLTPFQFDAASRATGLFRAGQIGWSPGTFEDLAVNLLVYLPVGFTLNGWVRRVTPLRTPALLVATLLGAALSLSVEALQAASPARCASWADVVLNTYGAFLGAATAPWLARVAHRVTGHLRTMVEEGALSFAALVMTTGLILHGAAPFDFAVSADDMHRSLLSSRWWPVAERYTPMSVERLLDPYGPLVSSIGMAGAFVLLGGVHALAERRRGAGREASILAAMGHAGVVSLAIETLRLFVRSRTFDTVDLVAGPLAAALGAWAAVGLSEPGFDRCAHSRTAVAVPAGMIAVIAVLQIAYALASAFAAFQPSHERFAASHVCLAPLYAYFRMPFLHAVGRLLSETLSHLLLIATLCVYLWRRSGQVRWRWVAVVVILVATVCEAVRFLAGAGPADPTAVVVALIAVLGCRAGYRRVVCPVPAGAVYAV